jgi:hypothetical protein
LRRSIDLTNCQFQNSLNDNNEFLQHGSLSELIIMITNYMLKVLLQIPNFLVQVASQFLAQKHFGCNGHHLVLVVHDNAQRPKTTLPDNIASDKSLRCPIF